MRYMASQAVHFFYLAYGRLVTFLTGLISLNTKRPSSRRTVLGRCLFVQTRRRLVSKRLRGVEELEIVIVNPQIQRGV